MAGVRRRRYPKVMPKTPLAWANLTHDRVRFALFVLGVVFAVVLMFIQLGFRGALLDSQSLFHEKLNADLVLISPNRQALAMQDTISRRRLVQASAVPGVAEVYPVFINNGMGVLRHTASESSERKPSRGIRVIGIDPESRALNVPELQPGSREVELLKIPGNSLFDRNSVGFPNETEFGPYTPGTTTELSGARVTFVGTVPFGPDFTSDGAMVVSTETFADLLRRPYTLGAPLADIDIGIVRLAKGTDRAAVQAELKRVLSRGTDVPDVDVVTVQELMSREQGFWLDNTPIGFAFGFGVFMGFAVGLVICYQILSGDVADHLGEYATLKAVGYSNVYLAKVVIQESLILAVAGYVAGLAVSYGLYLVLAEVSGLPMNLTMERCLWLFLATVLMCVISGLIAMVKLVRTDPADVF